MGCEGAGSSAAGVPSHYAEQFLEYSVAGWVQLRSSPGSPGIAQMAEIEARRCAFRRKNDRSRSWRCDGLRGGRVSGE